MLPHLIAVALNAPCYPMQMAAEEAAARAEEEEETFLGPMPPDVVAEAEEAGADRPTAEVLRICRCFIVFIVNNVRVSSCAPGPQACLPCVPSDKVGCSNVGWKDAAMRP